jgi:hypothetical protein
MQSFCEFVCALQAPNPTKQEILMETLIFTKTANSKIHNQESSANFNKILTFKNLWHELNPKRKWVRGPFVVPGPASSSMQHGGVAETKGEYQHFHSQKEQACLFAYLLFDDPLTLISLSILISQQNPKEEKSSKSLLCLFFFRSQQPKRKRKRIPTPLFNLFDISPTQSENIHYFCFFCS